MSVTAVEHPSIEERRAEGKEARKRMPPSSHAGWKPAADRPDPVALLEEQDATREPDLVPVRHGRMMVSAVHLLPRRGQDHGRRPQGHAPGRPCRPSSAATPTCRTSACSPRPSGPCCST